MWPLVSPPGVFKARNRAGRVRWHTSDMRGGHSGSLRRRQDASSLSPSAKGGQDADADFQVVDMVSAQARTRDTAKEKKRKRRDCRICWPAGGLRTEDTAQSVCVRPPSWRMSRDADGERRRGPACSAAPRAPRVKSRRGSLTHTHCEPAGSFSRSHNETEAPGGQGPGATGSLVLTLSSSHLRLTRRHGASEWLARSCASASE